MESRLLIIEDDEDLLEGLQFTFETEGYQVIPARNVQECRRRLKEETYDAMILDCNLPDGSGFEVCREVKQSYMIPILMLTARDTEMDEIKALELGADDFMSKPFSLAVLKIRLKKLIGKVDKETIICSNGIRVDTSSGQVSKDGKNIDLSKLEYQLLLLFLLNRNQIISKEQILSNIWDSQGNFVDDNTVAVNIRRLRAKVEEDAKNPKRIKTVHGMGYVWKESTTI